MKRIALILISSIGLSGLAACSTGFGLSIPIVPGLSMGVGSGGISVNTGIGPIGTGIGVNQTGQVSAGVGVGTGIGTNIGSSGVNAGVGIGTGVSTVLYDPNSNQNKSQK